MIMNVNERKIFYNKPVDFSSAKNVQNGTHLFTNRIFKCRTHAMGPFSAISAIIFVRPAIGP